MITRSLTTDVSEMVLADIFQANDIFFIGSNGYNMLIESEHELDVTIQRLIWAVKPNTYCEVELASEEQIAHYE